MNAPKYSVESNQRAFALNGINAANIDLSVLHEEMMTQYIGSKNITEKNTNSTYWPNDEKRRFTISGRILNPTREELVISVETFVDFIILLLRYQDFELKENNKQHQ